MTDYLVLRTTKGDIGRTTNSNQQQLYKGITFNGSELPIGVVTGYLTNKNRSSSNKNWPRTNVKTDNNPR